LPDSIAASPAFALAQQKVLKFIPQADLRILDPIATTAYITRNHGYMVYDTLFSIDEKFQVKPQMVDKWECRRTASPTRSRCARASSSTTARR
jgi:peptide/nickel transport system substrate-binding protein